jgi:hypothetical protein
MYINKYYFFYLKKKYIIYIIIINLKYDFQWNFHFFQIQFLL